MVSKYVGIPTTYISTYVPNYSVSIDPKLFCPMFGQQSKNRLYKLLVSDLVPAHLFQPARLLGTLDYLAYKKLN